MSASLPEPLRVVQVIDSLAPGGAEKSLAAIAPGLTRRGVQLEVVALKPSPGVQPALRNAGAAVTELHGSRRSWTLQLRGLIRERRPRLVHTTLFESDVAGRTAARLCGVPVVSTLANESYGQQHKAEHRTRRTRLFAAQCADAFTARFTVRLHAISGHVANVMARRLLYPRSRIDVIPRGRDPDELGCRTLERRHQTRVRLGVSPNERLLLTVARQEQQKGLDVLLAAVPRITASIPNCRVVVAGRAGNATQSLREQLTRIEHRSRIDFLGARSDVADLLCAADAFVLPSRWEGLGGAVLEAMALECPIVVSDLPAIREMVDDSTAVLVPPEKPDALAAAVLRTFATVDESRRRATAARCRFLERFTADAIAEQMIAFYRRALSGPHDLEP